MIGGKDTVQTSKTMKPRVRCLGTCSRTFLKKERKKKRLSSLRTLIFMRHGNFDTEKVSVTFSCVRIFTSQGNYSPAMA